ncbi:MAG: ABC transporter permease [Trueperaceae bacterium]|nr:ABC transporter permease [Trueperaceae bacterium]MCC6311637.1 ABC transporter permease [Trueperaceae bacterium]MCW5818294.1 ABC transporter permease [Trueperaceae bacterium]
MFGYVLRRLLQVIPTILGITLLLFVVVRFSGDPLAIYLGDDDMVVGQVGSDQVEALRARLGLDQPLPLQYVYFLRDALHGDFGRSFIYQNQPALPLVVRRLPATAALGGAALLIGILISLPAGLIAARFRNRFPDTFASFYAVVGEAIPNFWLGIMLILLFSVNLRLLPVSGSGTWRHLILPAFTLGTGMSALLMRLLRGNLIEVMSLDYIRTARAKGLSARSVLFKHGLRNAAISYITVLGLSVPGLLSGSVVTESIFAWPGMGLLFITAINGRDMAVVQAIVVFTAFLAILGNLVVDLVYVVVDPRITYR